MTLSASLPNSENLKIAFLGGCGEFGMNLTAYIFQGKVYIVDCGTMFPPDYYLGVDAVIPDLDSLLMEYDGPEAYVITHGHEDHIGGLPLFLQKWPAPIFATEWTAELIKSKMLFHKMRPDEFDFTIVSPGSRIANDKISFTYFHVNHSIPMTCSLGIETPTTKVFHTGDFKFDKAPIFEEPADYAGIAKWSEGGVDLLITDSTNSQSPGWSGSESIVIDSLEAEIRPLQGKVIIATFSSNLWRLLGILTVAKRVGRKVIFAGSGIKRCMDQGLKMGLVPPELVTQIGSEDEMDFLLRAQVIIVATGCQGEHKSALVRITSGQDKKIVLEEGDAVILSSRVIPGNERPLSQVISSCHKVGVIVLGQKQNAGLHVSGHAHQGELEHLMGLVNPKRYVAVHGTHSQLKANSALAIARGIETTSVENGAELVLSPIELKVLSIDDHSPIYIDSWSKNPMDQQNLRSRLKIGDSGLITVSGVFNKATKTWDQALEFELIGIALPIGFDLSTWKGSMINQTMKIIDQSASKSLSEVQDAINAAIKKSATVFLVKKPAVLTYVFLI